MLAFCATTDTDGELRLPEAGMEQNYNKKCIVVKRFLAILGFVALLNACTSQSERSSDAVERAASSFKPTASSPKSTSDSAKTANCADSFAKSAPFLTQQLNDGNKLYFDRFDFYTYKIVLP